MFKQFSGNAHNAHNNILSLIPFVRFVLDARRRCRGDDGLYGSVLSSSSSSGLLAASSRRRRRRSCRTYAAGPVSLQSPRTVAETTLIII